MGQNIISGIWDEKTYHFDYNPEMILYQPENNKVNKFDIDLNGDGFNDFRFTSLFKDGGKWYNEKRIEVEPLDQNQIAYLEIETCTSNDPLPLYVSKTYTILELEYNKTIDNNLNWADSTVTLAYYDWDAMHPTSMGFTCKRLSQFRSDSGYIAVRLIEPNDTLYGWIKVSNIDFYKTTWCIIHEYACTNNISGINSHEVNHGFNIFPNPASNYVTVQSTDPSQSIRKITIYNPFEVLKEYFFPNKNDIQINLLSFPEGLIIFQIEDKNGKIFFKKLIHKE